MMSKSKMGSLVLIGLGVLFLLSNFGWIPRLGHLFTEWWPVILIIVGIYQLVQR